MGTVDGESGRLELIEARGAPQRSWGPGDERWQHLKSARVDLIQGIGAAQISSARADLRTSAHNVNNETVSEH